MNPAKKILIIRFSSIGDIVLTTPVIRCIKEQVRNVEIHYLTKESFRGIVENNPHISRIFTLKEKLNDVIAELKKEDYDLIIDLHSNTRTWFVKLRLNRPHISFDKLNINKWLMVRLKRKMTLPHIVDRYLLTTTPLGVRNDGKGLDYFIPADDEVDLSALPETHRHGYIGFVIGAKHATKQLPADKIISICRKLDQPVVLLGGKEDAAIAEQIAGAVGKNIYNACGNYNLNQSASLVKQASRIISHDTGLMHIAAAFKKDITSVWGNTVPGFGFSPYLPGGRSVIAEVNGLSCRPCSKLGYDKCPKGHFKCMKEIDETIF